MPKQIENQKTFIRMKEQDYTILDERIEKYLSGGMPTEEETLFEEDLKSSQELNSRTYMTALLIDSMDKVGKERDQHIIDDIKNMSEEEFRAAIKPHRVVRLWPQIIAYAAVACVIGFICTVGINAYHSVQYRELATDSQYLAYETITSEEIGRSRGVIDKSQTDKMLALFAKAKSGQDLDETIDGLSKMYSQSKDESSDYYDYCDDIAWNLAFAYLKNGDGEKAIPILKEMQARNKEWPEITDKINRLIKAIEDI